MVIKDVLENTLEELNCSTLAKIRFIMKALLDGWTVKMIEHNPEQFIFEKEFDKNNIGKKITKKIALDGDFEKQFLLNNLNKNN
jgi:hypothetical protein|tara:strand:- start:141 stop:392 length:252 start_codon:yes stop_codon:yes gene_type:complete